MFRSTDITNEKPRVTPCTQNYFPCECVVDYDGIAVTCNYGTVQEIQDVFRRTTDPYIFQFTFKEVSYERVPADFLAGKSVSNINFEIGSGTTFDPLAFRTTQKNTTSLTFFRWSLLAMEDMNFLNGFNALKSLHFVRDFDIQVFQYLPSLPSLTHLEISQSSSLANTTFPDLTPARLERLFLPQNRLGDNITKYHLESIARSSSASSLKEIFLRTNELTTVPPMLHLFTNLNYVDVDENFISRINQSSLTFSSPMSYLSIVNNNLSIIENGAFSKGTRGFSNMPKVAHQTSSLFK